MEEKKNNKGLVWIIIILIILVLGLVGYIVYDKVLVQNKTISNNNNTNTTTKLDSDNKVDNENKKQILVSTEIEQGEYEDNYKKLIINNKVIDLDGRDLDNVMFLDDSHIIATFKGTIEGESTYYVFDSNGKKLYNLDELSSLKGAITVDAHFSDNSLHIETITTPTGDNYRSLCELNQSDIYSKFEVLNYLGDGKFSKAETITEYTVKEFLEVYHDYSCN